MIERTYNAPLAVVWKAISNKEDMQQWYFKDLVGYKPVIGNEFEFTAGKDDKQFLHLCKVTEVIENKKISYTWRYDGYDGNSLVTFELFPEGEKTKLKLTHAGLESFPAASGDFAKENFANGWGGFVNIRLKEFLEGK
ncbi:MAG TPA: SRPBCC domain-containing protein [Bacteroidia bacterium]|nr:SRPBCC domain-containing protein [Bacteroidia bacterium]